MNITCVVMDTCTLLHIEDYHSCEPLGRACEEANCRLNPVFSTTQKVSLLNVLKMNKRTNVQHSQYFTVLQRGQNKLPEIFVLNFLQDNIIFTVHMFDGHHMPTGTLIFTEII